jgi:hypothetical protein
MLLVLRRRLLLLRLALGFHPNASASWLLVWLIHRGPAQQQVNMQQQT